MRKILLMTMAFAALTLTNCGNKTDANASADSTATDSTLTTDSTSADAFGVSSIKLGDASAAPATIAAITKEIQAKINSKDAQGLITLLSNVKAKIAQLAKENPEEAKNYLSQLQQYINQHSTEIKSIASGNSTITQAVDEVKNLNPESVVKTIASAAASDASSVATSAASTAKNAAEDAVNSKVNEATSKVEEAKQAAANKANEEVNKANKKATDAANKANKKVNDAVNNATNKALKGLGL